MMTSGTEPCYERPRQARRSSFAAVRNSGSHRSPSGLTWARLCRDRWSLGALCVVVAILLVSFAGGPVASRILGHNGYDQFPYAASISQKPVGPWTRVPALLTGLGNTESGDLTPPPAGTKTTLFVFRRRRATRP